MIADGEVSMLFVRVQKKGIASAKETYSQKYNLTILFF